MKRTRRSRVSLRVLRWLKTVNQYSNKPWYELFMMFLSALDAYILLVPNEPLIAAGAITKPKRWLRISLWMTLGSALGALSVAALLKHWSGWILAHLVSQKLLTSKSWHDSVLLIQHHGWWGLSLISLGPFPQHAAVIFAGLSGMPLIDVFFAVLLGRGVKYVAIAWIAVHSPNLLRRWGILPEAARKKK